MADQASVNGGSRVRINSPLTGGVIGNLAEFGNDFATLAELQAKLALIDAQEAAGRAALPGVALAAGGALALGALPVLLAGVAGLITRYGGLDIGWSLLIVAVGAFVLAGVLALVAWARFSASFESFRRSREEFTRNAMWIKTVLAHSGRPPSRGRG